MSPEQREVYVRLVDHIGEGVIVQRELRDALRELPERIVLSIPPPAPLRMHGSERWAVAAIVFLAALSGTSLALAVWR
jgi:hypothetical protein